MRIILTSTALVISVALILVFLSLCLSLMIQNPAWFQAAGSLLVIAGGLLAARKIIRLGLKDFIADESVIDGGHFEPTQEEIEANKQFELDLKAYRYSVWLLVAGTLLAGYGDILLRFFGVGCSA